MYSSDEATSIAILNPSITADICDMDELQTGQRREGMYGAVWGFAFKVGISAISLILGLMISWTGFMAGASVQSAETITRMRLLTAFVPFTFLVAGGIFFASRFPLNRARLEGIQAQLHRRHSTQQGARHEEHEN